MKSPIIGAHLSVAGGFTRAFTGANDIGASAVQVFAKSPMSGRMYEVSKEDAAAVRALPDREKVQYTVIHASYLLNFAKAISPDNYQIRSLAEDIRSIAKLDGDGVVVHMGKTLDRNPKDAEDDFVKNISIALNETAGLSAKVILENTAGQGSEMGYRLDEYGSILKRFGKNKRIGSCIDTAHLFAGGYDFSNKSGALEAVSEIEKHVGLERISCVHFNDSKKPVGSRVDRHEDIGRGTIGEAGLRAFAQKLHAERADIPFILETPEGFLPYKEQIALFQSWF